MRNDTRLVIRTCGLGAGLLALLLGAGEARAGIEIGADAGVAKNIGTGSDLIELGYGGKARLGFSLPVPLLYVAFEYATFSPKAPLTGSSTMLLAMGGGRVGFGTPIQPWAEIDIGFGNASGDPGGATQTGPVLGMGGGLDFTLLPIVRFGVHVIYMRISGDTEAAGAVVSKEPTEWLDIGANATLNF
jgi:hypothetical protein